MRATERTLGWPLEPGTAPKIAELIESGAFTAVEEDG